MRPSRSRLLGDDLADVQAGHRERLARRFQRDMRRIVGADEEVGARRRELLRVLHEEHRAKLGIVAALPGIEHAVPSATQVSVISGCMCGPSRATPSRHIVRKHKVAPSKLCARMPICFMVHSTVTLFARLRGWSTSVPLSDRDMIGEQLHRHGIDQRRDQRVDLGHLDRRHAALAGLGDALGVGDQDDLAAARADFLHVADGLLEQRARRREDDHRHSLVDQRDRAVLHLARGIAFGVDVADFLELQRAFQRQRIIRAAAEIEHVARRRDEVRHGRDVVVMAERGVQRRRALRCRWATISCSSSRVIRPLARARLAASAASTASWQVKALVEATPISGPAWVGSSRSASRAIELVGTLTTTAIVCPSRAGVAQRGERVGGLARLGDEQRQPARLEHRLAVAELADATSMSTGTRANCSNQYLATMPA